MRIQIKAPEGLETSGLYGEGGKEIPVGTEFEVENEPVEWAGRYVVVAETKGKTPANGKKAAEDPAKTELEALDVDALAKLAADEKIDLGGASAKGDMVDAILKARAAKA
jgi:hypothetical protein